MGDFVGTEEFSPMVGWTSKLAFRGLRPRKYGLSERSPDVTDHFRLGQPDAVGAQELQLNPESGRMLTGAELFIGRRLPGMPDIGPHETVAFAPVGKARRRRKEAQMFVAHAPQVFVHPGQIR